MPWSWNIFVPSRQWGWCPCDSLILGGRWASILSCSNSPTISGNNNVGMKIASAYDLHVNVCVGTSIALVWTSSDSVTDLGSQFYSNATFLESHTEASFANLRMSSWVPMRLHSDIRSHEKGRNLNLHLHAAKSFSCMGGLSQFQENQRIFACILYSLPILLESCFLSDNTDC